MKYLGKHAFFFNKLFTILAFSQKKETATVFEQKFLCFPNGHRFFHKFNLPSGQLSKMNWAMSPAESEGLNK